MGKIYKTPEEKRIASLDRWREKFGYDPCIIGQKKCPNCGTMFTPGKFTPKQKYCCKKCQSAHYKKSYNRKSDPNKARKEKKSDSYRMDVNLFKYDECPFANGKIRMEGDRIPDAQLGF